MSFSSFQCSYFRKMLWAHPYLSVISAPIFPILGQDMGQNFCVSN